MNKKIIGTALIVSTFGVAGALWSSWSGDESAKTIKLSGNIELTEINVAFKAPGKLVALSVDEGSAVKNGMVLARIDKDQIQRQQEKEQAGVAAAESQLTQLKTAIEYGYAKTQSDVALKRAELAQAEAHLEELLAGSRPQEVQQAKAAVADAQTQHEQAMRDWNRAQTLYRNDDISTAQRDQFQARFESTAATLRQVEERFAIVQEGPRREQIDAGRAQVEQARAALRLSEAEWIELKRKEQEVTAKRAEIEKARAQVAVIDSQIADTVAVSPIDGIVLTKSADLGEVLSSGTTVVTLGDMDRPWVRGYIAEPDLGRVKIGSKVRVTTDSYPDKSYAGRITFIASNAEFTPKQIQTNEERVKLVYRVKIEVENPAHELKLNMPVDAEIVLNN
jgi:HlyD family secretion protein